MKKALLLLVLLLLPVLVEAQPVVNPNTFDWTPASDYTTVGAIDGLPVVVSTDVLVSTQAAPNLTIATLPCGKPALVAGKVICQIPQAFKDSLPRNTLLVAKERANGQPGTQPGVSAAGAPFGFAGLVNPLVGGPPEPKP